MVHKMKLSQPWGVSSPIAEPLPSGAGTFDNRFRITDDYFIISDLDKDMQELAELAYACV